MDKTNSIKVWYRPTHIRMFILSVLVPNKMKGNMKGKMKGNMGGGRLGLRFGNDVKKRKKYTKLITFL